MNTKTNIARRATPYELDLIKAGIDTVVKIQTKNGRNTALDMCPVINSREGYYKAKIITGFGDAAASGRGESVPSDRKIALYEFDMYPLRFAKAFEYDIHSKDEDQCAGPYTFEPEEEEPADPFAHPLVPALCAIALAALFVVGFAYLWAAFVWVLKVTP